MPVDELVAAAVVALDDDVPLLVVLALDPVDVPVACVLEPLADDVAPPPPEPPPESEHEARSATVKQGMKTRFCRMNPR
jgi:hypothetical protein